MSRCPPELLVRWAQFGCFTPLMQAHGRFEQEAWTYDRRTLDLFPGRRAPARAARALRAHGRRHRRRPLRAAGRAPAHGPSLWVAPVLEAGAREREADLPRGDWIEAWSERLVAGGGEVVAPAPLERIPVWVRRGALVVTYPAEHVAAGLGDTPERERPL